MKYVVVLGDGMADYACPQLNGKTPLQYAHTPHMDAIASKGQIGLVHTVPQDLAPGSDVANLSVLGYNPQRYYTGRSPLEALSMGIDLQKEDIAFRCNLVTLSGPLDAKTTKMIDYSAGEISTAEAQELLKTIGAAFNTTQYQFYAGISYRHLMIWKNGPDDLILTPPHDISKQTVHPHLPQGKGAEILLDFMRQSMEILQQHPINQKRKEQGLPLANSLWFWGQGKKPYLPSFQEKFGIKGAVISAVDLIKGIGLCAGMQVIEVPGCTGNIHTNFSGKAAAAQKALQEGIDFVYIHIEAPDEAGHQGDLQTKIKAIEEIDQKIIGPVWECLRTFDSYGLMVLPDHPTPICTLTHARDPVPFACCATKERQNQKLVYDEETAAASGLIIPQGHTLLERFIKGF